LLDRGQRNPARSGRPPIAPATVPGPSCSSEPSPSTWRPVPSVVGARSSTLSSPSRTASSGSCATSASRPRRRRGPPPAIHPTSGVVRCAASSANSTRPRVAGRGQASCSGRSSAPAHPSCCSIPVAATRSCARCLPTARQPGHSCRREPLTPGSDGRHHPRAPLSAPPGCLHHPTPLGPSAFSPRLFHLRAGHRTARGGRAAPPLRARGGVILARMSYWQRQGADRGSVGGAGGEKGWGLARRPFPG
jgi:hypothetical protein